MPDEVACKIEGKLPSTTSTLSPAFHKISTQTSLPTSALFLYNRIACKCCAAFILKHIQGPTCAALMTDLRLAFSRQRSGRRAASALPPCNLRPLSLAGRVIHNLVQIRVDGQKHENTKSQVQVVWVGSTLLLSYALGDS
jgi:hypothetical protein